MVDRLIGPHPMIYEASVVWGDTPSPSGSSDAAGTTSFSGFTKSAFADGTRGRQLRNSGKGLVGELGAELVVRDGKFFTVGENGAEMFAYKKGDIIFNANQTSALLSRGFTGSAYATGTVDGTVDWQEINAILAGKVSPKREALPTV